MVQCPAIVWDDVRCELEDGHDGDHFVTADLPDDVTTMVAKVMNEAAAAIALAESARRGYRRGFWVMIGAAVLNLIAAGWAVSRMVGYLP